MAVSEHIAEPNDGDFLDGGVTPEPPAYGVPTDRPATGPASRWQAALRPAAWLAAGVVAGAVVVSAWHSSTTSPNANPAAAQGPFAGGQAPGGQGPGQGQFPGGPPGSFNGGPGGPGGGGFGGRAGEQHVFGTVTAIGTSSVTVKLTNGSTATYGVVASSDLVKDGARVSLSAVKPGDAVFLHVYPLNGKTVVEHLLVGTAPPPRRV